MEKSKNIREPEDGGPEKTKEIRRTRIPSPCGLPARSTRMNQEIVLTKNTTWLQIDQAVPGLLLPLWSSPRIAGRLLLLLHKASLLGNARILLTRERVIARLIGVQTIQTLTGRVDERSWRGVLRRDTEVSNIAEGVQAFTRGKKRVQTSVMRV